MRWRGITARLFCSSTRHYVVTERQKSRGLVIMSRRGIMVKKRKTTEHQEGESPLKKLRDELGDISQEEFARRIGTSVRTVSRWEAGDSIPTFTIPQVKALARLLESYGKSVYDLPNEFGPQRPSPIQEVNGR